MFFYIFYIKNIAINIMFLVTISLIRFDFVKFFEIFIHYFLNEFSFVANTGYFEIYMEFRQSRHKLGFLLLSH